MHLLPVLALFALCAADDLPSGRIVRRHEVLDRLPSREQHLLEVDQGGRFREVDRSVKQAPAATCTSTFEFNPDESSRSYSSIWDNNAIGTGHAQSTLDSGLAWCAKSNEVGQWMQLDLGQAYTVGGVTVQGRDQHDQTVTQYSVQTSQDGVTFSRVPGSFQRATSLARNARVVGSFTPVHARYVRIVVEAWHNHISMRAAVVICQAPSTCTAKELNPDESTRSYSSIWDNNAVATGHARSALDSAQAWSSQKNEAGQWMQMDLGVALPVMGVVVQGRADAEDQKVTRYTIQTSSDGSTFKTAPGLFTRPASYGRNARVEGRLLANVHARYVRIVVEQWTGHISMRAGVLTCEEMKMPQMPVSVAGPAGPPGPPGKRGPSGVQGRAGAPARAPPKVNCAWDLWASWGVCTRSCDGGQRERTRSVKVYPQNGGRNCVGDATEVQDCGQEACPTTTTTTTTTTAATTSTTANKTVSVAAAKSGALSDLRLGHLTLGFVFLLHARMVLWEGI